MRLRVIELLLSLRRGKVSVGDVDKDLSRIIRQYTSVTRRAFGTHMEQRTNKFGVVPLATRFSTLANKTRIKRYF